MWWEEKTDKDGKTYYRYYEKYKDPLTEKWKRTSVRLNRNTKQSQKEAIRLLNEKIDQIVNDKTPESLKQLRLHALIDEYFENYKITSGSKVSTINIKEYKLNRIKEHTDPDILVKNINLKTVQDLIDLLVKEEYSHKSITESLNNFKAILKYARRKYDLKDISYLDLVTVPKSAKTRDEIIAKRENYLEWSEVLAIVKWLSQESTKKIVPHKKRAFYICARVVEFQALNGLRIGELLALQPDNIDFDNKLLTIDGTIDFKRRDGEAVGVKDTAKTKSSYRTINLSDRSVAILKELIHENKKTKLMDRRYIDRGFIFTNFRGNPLSKSSINRQIKQAAAEVGITKKITTHTFRHTHISILFEIGADLPYVMDRVGHADSRTTLEIYAHVTHKMKDDTLKKLNMLGS